MAKKDQCEWYDFIDDKPSELHKELIRREGRPTGNYLYALYKTSNIAEKMDEEKDNDGNLLYKRNNQGQHDARDILKFIDWGGAHRESLDKAAISIGAKDARNNPIDYTDAYDALKRAEELNDTRKHLIANVYKHGDVYNIIVSERTSRNFTQADEVKSKIKLYDFYKQAFAASGIDITNIPKGLENYFSAFNGGLARYLQSIKRSELRYMLKDDALMILFLNQDSPHTQRVINAFGSMEDTAQAVLDYNRGTGSFTNGQLTLLKRAMENGKTFPNLNLDAIQEQAESISKDIREESGSEDIKQELHRLNKKYHIDFNECHKVNSRIESLSDAAVEAVLAIERQIRLLEKQEGTTEEGRRLSRIKDKYHIVAFTASHESYADSVLNCLDPNNKYFEYRLYRAHCVLMAEMKFYIKDLKILEDNYDLKDVVIIDNSVLSFAYHLDNGIPISPFYDSKDDTELLDIADILVKYANENDIRDKLKEIYKLTQYLEILKNNNSEEEEKKDSSDISVNEEENKGGNTTKNCAIMKNKTELNLNQHLNNNMDIDKNDKNEIKSGNIPKTISQFNLKLKEISNMFNDKDNESKENKVFTPKLNEEKNKNNKKREKQKSLRFDINFKKEWDEKQKEFKNKL